MNITQKLFWRKHKTNIIGGGSVLLLLLASSGKITQNIADSQKMSSIISQNRMIERKAEESRRVAHDRYKECLPIVSSVVRDGRRFQSSAIYEGQVIRDRNTKLPLPPGVIVCDFHGNTGIINEAGEVSNTAFTGDREVIVSRQKRFRGAQYTQPIGE